MSEALLALSQLHHSLTTLHSSGLVSDDALEMLLGGEGFVPRLGVVVADYESAEEGLALREGEQVFITAALTEYLLLGTTAIRISQHLPLASIPSSFVQAIEIPEPSTISTSLPPAAPPPLPNRRTLPPPPVFAPTPIPPSQYHHSASLNPPQPSLDLSQMNAMTLSSPTATPRHLPPPLPVPQAPPPSEATKKKSKGFGNFFKPKTTTPPPSSSPVPFYPSPATASPYPPPQPSHSFFHPSPQPSPPPTQPQPQTLTFNQRQQLARGEVVSPTPSGLQQDTSLEKRREEVVRAGGKVKDAALGGAGFAL